MCACAGSLTRASRLQGSGRGFTLHLLCCPGTVRPAREVFSSISPAWSRWIAARQDKGFMSTQRRENRWRPVRCMDRATTPGHSSPAFFARYVHARADGGTAPPASPAWLATNSLQSDRRTTQIVRLVRLNIRRGSPPPGAGNCAAAATFVSFRSSFPLIPSPSGFACFHPTLPQVPAAMSCWTERYDGKRDLHLQHAA
jgi:hypothetical protein